MDREAEEREKRSEEESILRPGQERDRGPDGEQREKHWSCGRQHESVQGSRNIDLGGPKKRRRNLPKGRLKHPKTSGDLKTLKNPQARPNWARPYRPRRYLTQQM